MDKISNTRYNKAPVINHKRTRFDLSHNVLDTCDTGDFVCCLCEPVYPGETHSLKSTSLTRLETSLHQTMDNAYVEFAYFFVPTRCIFEDFEKLMGANDDPWTQLNNYEIPQLWLSHGANTGAQGKVKTGSLLNHLGIPAGDYYGPAPGVTETFDGTKSISIDQLPVRAIFKVWSDWYRDENFDSVIYFPVDGSLSSLSTSYLLNGNQFKPSEDCLKVNRFHDVFSSALPGPQKAQDVTVNVLSNSYAPVITQNAGHNVSSVPVKFVRTDGNAAADGSLGITGGNLWTDGAFGSASETVVPSNYYADMTGQELVTINQLRLAIVRQAMAERDARGGTRMNEKIASIWNISVPSLEIDRSEFLGGKRIPINMMEVLQTSETGNTVLGTDAGHSKTLDYDDGFTRSFTQYGYLLGFVYIRTSRSYSQGIDRKFFIKDKLDLVDPMLDNIGEVPILKREIFGVSAGGTQNPISSANSAWGYQEQYYWVKERTNQFRGYFQSGISGTLDTWHYGDDYTTVPSLSADWLKETDNQVSRTIAVTSVAQWSLNIHFEYYATRELSKYSIPNSFGF